MVKIKVAVKNVKSRPKTQRGKVILYMDRPLLAEFKKVCRKQGVAASSVIEAAVRKYLDSLK